MCFGLAISNDSPAIQPTTSINNDQWQFVTATRNNSNGAINLYINGRSEALATLEIGPLDNEPTIFFGKVHGSTVSTAPFFNGQMDDIRIYNRAL